MKITPNKSNPMLADVVVNGQCYTVSKPQAYAMAYKLAAEAWQGKL